MQKINPEIPYTLDDVINVVEFLNKSDKDYKFFINHTYSTRAGGRKVVLDTMHGKWVFHEYTHNQLEVLENEAFINKINHFIDNELAKPKGTNWDHRMLKLAAGEINTWSKDPSTKVSAVIFRGKHPVAMSYNGFPPGIADTDERLNNRELKYKFVQHAEANAISTCAKLGIATEGTTMAVTHHPCPTCAGQMISAGIAKVICQPPSPDFLSRWADDVNLAKQLFKEAGVELVIIDLED